jgi:hypothetical protein
MANLTPLNFSAANNTSAFNVTAVTLPFMDKAFLGNTVREYVVALIFFVAAVVVLKL